MIKNILIIFVVALSMFAPRIASAEVKAFCIRLPDVEIAEKKKILEQESSYRSKKDAQLALLTSKRVANDKKKLDERIKTDTVSMKSFEKLFTKATGSEQKKAVENFKKTILDAISTKRKAVDTATNTYRSDADKNIALKKKAMEDAWATLVASPAKAAIQARADCMVDKSATNKHVQTTFETVLKESKKAYEDSIKSFSSEYTEKNLEKVFQVKIAKAQIDYETAVSTAVTNLRTALPSTKK